MSDFVCDVHGDLPFANVHIADGRPICMMDENCQMRLKLPGGADAIVTDAIVAIYQTSLAQQ